MSWKCERQTIYIIAAVLGDILLIAFLRYVWHLSLFDVFVFLALILLNGVAIYVGYWISLEYPTLVLAGTLAIPLACIHLFVWRIDALTELWGRIKILTKIGHVLVLTFLIVYSALWMFLAFSYFNHVSNNTSLEILKEYGG
ncbi:uncharacterized protein [Drosophila pseudoobscura]|uniref:Uncharacterized protein isoform X1 n=1 Tax=Drosophila pseudoobscura pseudoobscura TaxID=46245 RepID=A0A6I8VFX1_DROPS|nr:uncharacterized protein LOC26534449 isoform X1 [Drosophila pseudoobscura]